MSINKKKFIDCKGKQWFEKLSPFTKAKMVNELNRATYEEYGMSYEEYIELENTKNEGL